MRRLIWGVVVALALGAGPAWGEAGQAPAAALRAPAELIDLNQASATELESLPGVGERTAERIIEYRRGDRRIQEDRRAHERAWHRRAQLSQIAAAGHHR